MTDQVIQCTQACTITVQHEFVVPVLNISAGDGVLISGAVLLIWSLGWGFRVLIQTLRYTDGGQSQEE